MRVLYDSQIFQRQWHGGVSRLFSELVSHYHRSPDIEVGLCIDHTHNDYIDEIERSGLTITDYGKFLGGRRFKGKAKVYRAVNALKKRVHEQERTLMCLKRGYYDIFHPSYYGEYFLHSLENTPLVVTVFDMIHEVFPDQLYDPELIRIKKLLVNRAKRVIAISHSTKKDMVRLLKVDPNKVDVVHLGATMPTVRSRIRPSFAPKRYILFVGHREGYKNFDFALRSLAPLMQNDRSLCLVCIGGKIFNGRFPTDELALIRALKLDRQVLIFDASDPELSAWYQGAECLIFPSRYEGFGLPILEAFASGCPVASADNSSLPEVAGEASIFFDATSSEAILRAVETIIYSKTQQDEMRQAGYEQLERFSWGKCAEETRRVYRRAMI